MSTDASAAPTERIPWESPTVRIVLLSTLLAPLGVPLVSPALPVLRDTFGVTDTQVSLVVSAYFVAGIVLSPFLGVLADRVGRRRVLVASLLLFGVAGGALAFAPSFAALVAVRVVQGVAAAGIFIATVTLITDAFDDARRNAVLGVNTAVLSAGAAIFPLVGGVLVAVAWNAPFLAYLLALPAGLYAAARLPEPARESTVERGFDYVRGAARTLSTGDATVVYGSTFATEFVAFGAVFTVLPFLLVGQYGLAPVVVGAVLTAAEAASIAAAVANGRLARRVSNRALIVAGFACYGVGLVGAFLASGALLVAAAVVVVGAGFGFLLPSIDAELGALVPTRFRAGAVSLRNSTTFLGRAAGPVVFTGVAATTGYATLLLAAGVASLAIALWTFVAARRRTPAGDVSEGTA